MSQLEKGKVKVVLLEDVSGLGNSGDNKDVATGFARNYLFPRHLATLATPLAMKNAEERRKRESKRYQKTRSAQEEAARELDGFSLKITAKAGTRERLFGSITAADISRKLQEATGYNIDKRKFILPQALRHLGTYEIRLQMAPDLTPKLNIEIVAE